MNLISNKCIGCFINKDIYKQQHQNPFVGTQMDDKSYNELFVNYDVLDFNNFEITTDNGKCNGRYSIIIDKKVKADFIHIHFSKDDTAPRKRNDYWQLELFYNRPWEYLFSTYKRRLSRMHDKPIFVYLDLDNRKNYELSNIAKKFKKSILIITVDNNFPKNEYTKIVYVNKEDWNKINWWKYIQDNYLNGILKYIDEIKEGI